jgi:hypothetical protein
MKSLLVLATVYALGKSMWVDKDIVLLFGRTTFARVATVREAGGFPKAESWFLYTLRTEDGAS